MLRMPMARCSRCALRQYAPTPYITKARCAVCDAPLVLSRVGSTRPSSERFVRAVTQPSSTSR
jgi:hypothetical protein